MHAKVDKPKENKSPASANSVARQKSFHKQEFRFIDNRPATIVQTKVLKMAERYPKNASFQMKRSGMGIFDDIGYLIGKQSEQLQKKNALDVIQRNGKGADNWLRINQYSSSTAKKIEKAFLKAGYSYDQMETVIPNALNASPKWKNKKIAHGLGKKTSKKRGGTDKSISQCAEYLIGWAQENPAE